mgnify:CR=1 FL=1
MHATFYMTTYSEGQVELIVNNDDYEYRILAECRDAMVYLSVSETDIPHRYYKSECEYDAWSAIENLVHVLRYEAKPSGINDAEFDGMDRQIAIMQRNLIDEERFSLVV